MFSLLALVELEVERESLLELSNAPSQRYGAGREVGWTIWCSCSLTSTGVATNCP